MNIKLILRPYYRELKCFSFRALKWRLRLKKCGKAFYVGKGVCMFNPKYISVGNNVILNHHTSLFVNPLNDCAELIIKDGVQLGKYNDFGCSNKIIIEENVITAPFVHITDRDHSYYDLKNPIMYQPANSKGPVIIKRGCWIGFGAQIMSGVTIGKNSVVAAGSIITKDIPDYCMAGGNPAKIIKKYNPIRNLWEKC